MRVLIVYSGSGRGLTKDAQILKAAVRAHGHFCTVQQLSPPKQWQRDLERRSFVLLKRLTSKKFQKYCSRVIVSFVKLVNPAPTEDLVIHLENIQPTQLWKSRRHWLVPNQEWFVESRRAYLPQIESILGKTAHAVGIFESLHPSTHFLGFTGDISVDNLRADTKDFSLALHVGGNSQFKGTRAVIDCWQRHPEWPRLVVVSQHTPDRPFTAANIEIRQNLEDKELAALWEKAGYAIQPSEVEGYGQVLAEALANGCVTITTDAPPMNELVSPKLGFLTRPTSTQKFRLGTRFNVTPADLEAAIATALKEPTDALRQRSQLSREWYVANHSNFLQRLGELLNAQPRQLSTLYGPTQPEKHRQ